jgi:glycosyltransferase involved in cell wall biosynthesis
VIASGSSERSVATGKLYEYVAAERPILVIGDRSEAARIVAATGTGLSAPGDDPEAIAGALLALVGGAAFERRPEVVAEYSWEVLARRAEEIIEEVCTR